MTSLTTVHPTQPKWRKSSLSGSGTNCVEVAPLEIAATQPVK